MNAPDKNDSLSPCLPRHMVEIMPLPPDLGPEAPGLPDQIRTPSNRFKLLSGDDLLNATPMRWMIRGVLPREGIASVYGASMAGKTFLVLDISFAVADGEHAWFGRRVKKCPVTYCALEGEAGLGKRVAACSARHKSTIPEALRFFTQSFDLLNPADLAELASAIQSEGGANGLIVLDTLNRAAPGADENSSADMGNIIAAAKRLQDIVGGLVLLVHHTGKDATKGLRGHSSLFAALDAAIEVNMTGDRREWVVAKSKDDEAGATHAFRLELVKVGVDSDGQEIGSCVVVADDSVKAIKRAKLPRGKHQKTALETLAEPLRESKEFDREGAPLGCPCLRLDVAEGLVAERMACDAKHKIERARQAISALIQSGIYGSKDGWLWQTELRSG